MKLWYDSREESSSDKQAHLVWFQIVCPGIEVYKGCKGEAEQNQTKNVIVRLTNPLQDKGYQLFTDNFYKSKSFFFDFLI